MKLRIAKKTADSWVTALLRARFREIGGILFGEHVGDADFRVVEATIQSRGGNHATFRRNSAKARRDLKTLSRRHGDDPARFNYLGEWHSHPRSPVAPSSVDEITMRGLLTDPDATVNFLVLLIIRLSDFYTLEISAVAYLVSGHKIPCEIILESHEDK